MKKWYSFYNEQVVEMQQVAAEMPRTKMQQAAAKFGHQLGGQLEPLGVATYQLKQVVERTVLELRQREEKKD